MLVMCENEEEAITRDLLPDLGTGLGKHQGTLTNAVAVDVRIRPEWSNCYR